jgi:hypothetical protein
MRLLLLLLLTSCSYQTLLAQKHVCGTHQEPLIPRIIENKKALAANEDLYRAPATSYIPLKFHLVATTDGTNRVGFSSVLDQLCRFNQDYETAEMVGYLKDGYQSINNVDDSKIFEEPYTSSAIIKMRNQFDDKSINIFVTNSADSGNGVGTVLGYYDPSEDFLVMRQKEVIDSSSTLSHEVGHFFSLAHPFFGWEGEPYSPAIHGNPVNFSVIQPGNFLVELVDRSNCNNSADRICDTPASYLFGFGDGVSVSGCNLVTQVFDKNVDLVVPMTNNMMDYFEQCTKYEFTPDQRAVMQADLASPSRAYIRSNYIPTTAPITSAPQLVYPTTSTLVENYNSVYFDWTDVANAEMYLIELQDVFSGEKREYFSTSSDLWVTDLEASRKYAYFVHPFNETSSCYKTTKAIFDTGAMTTSTQELNSVIKMDLAPNPSSMDERQIAVLIEAETAIQGRINILTLEGKVLNSAAIDLQSGKHKVVLESPAEAGMYLVQISTTDGILTRKLVKQ